MVLDESALEAMLARQRAAERDHEHAASVRTVKTEEFEVYERQPASVPEGRPASSVRPPPSAVAPASNAGRPVPPDFEELPGRAQGVTPTPDETMAPRPADPDSDVAQHVPLHHPAPIVDAARRGGPIADHVQFASPTSPQPVIPAPDAAPRRPQVWPPIGTRTATAPSPSARDAQPPANAPAPAAAVPSTPAPEQAAEPPAERTAPRSHAPTPHAVPQMHADGTGCRIAIVQAMFNQEITDLMAERAIERATQAGADASRHRVPGVYDLPLLVQTLARRRDVDAVVVIGCVVRGETKHDELITVATAKTLQDIALATETPVALGIIGPGMTWQQAQARIQNGAHAVDAAISMWRALQTA